MSAQVGREIVKALSEIRSFVGRLAGPRLPREELEQIVAVRVLDRARRAGIPRDLRSYCMAVARREASRGPGAIARRTGPPGPLEAAAAREAGPLEAAIAVEERARVAVAMDRLLPSRAESLRRLYWDAVPLGNDGARSRTTSRARFDFATALAEVGPVRIGVQVGPYYSRPREERDDGGARSPS